MGLSVQCMQCTHSSVWWIWSSAWSRTTSSMNLWRFTSKWQVLCCEALCGSCLYVPVHIRNDKSTLCFRQIHILTQHMGTWSPTGMAVCTISCICSWLLQLLGGKSYCVTETVRIYPSVWNIMCLMVFDNGGIMWFTQGQLPSHWTLLGGLFSHVCHSLHSWQRCGWVN